MDIRFNKVAGSMLLAVSSCYASMEFNTDVSLGMNTTPKVLGYRKASSVPQSDLSERILLSSLIGQERLEYLDLEVNYHMPVAENMGFKAFSGLGLTKADIGARFEMLTPVYSGVNLTAFFDVYRSIYYQEAKLVGDMSLDIDFGINAEVYMQNCLYMFFKVKQPIIEDQLIAIKGKTIPVNNQFSLSMGLKVKYDWLEDEGDAISFPIIQEPIRISIEELEEMVFEDLDDEEAFIEEEPVRVSFEDVDEEEPQGWFAWLIEFIARLFRF